MLLSSRLLASKAAPAASTCALGAVRHYASSAQYVDITTLGEVEPWHALVSYDNSASGERRV